MTWLNNAKFLVVTDVTVLRRAASPEKTPGGNIENKVSEDNVERQYQNRDTQQGFKSGIGKHKKYGGSYFCYKKSEWAKLVPNTNINSRKESLMKQIPSRSKNFFSD